MAQRNYREETNISEQYSRRLIRGRVTATAGIHNIDNLNMSIGAGANRIDILRALEKQNLFNIIWYIVFIVLGIACLIIAPKGWFNVIDLFVLMVNIDLVSRGKLLGVYIGIAECFMYAWICFNSGLYGEVIKMFVINVPLNIFTLVSWTKNLKKSKQISYKTEEENTLEIRAFPKKYYWALILICAVLYVGCYFGLKLLKTSALIFSAGVMVCSIVNKVLSGMRYKESWLFSILSHTISIGMWVMVIIEASKTGLNLEELAPLISTLASLSNGFYGWYLWRGMYNKEVINNKGEILNKRPVKINRIIKLRRKYQQLFWDRDVDTKKNS